MLEPYHDRERHTILKINDIETKEVRYIPLDIVGGLKIVSMSRAKFNDAYKPIPDYPIKKAVGLFMGYAKTLGASKEVLKLFSKVGIITKDIPDNTGQCHKELELGKKPTEPKLVKELNKVKKLTKPKPVEELNKVESSKIIDDEFKSAAAMFQGLIMAGKLTDPEIFLAVQEKFGVDNEKKWYVKWYRHSLKRKGKNPPNEVKPEATKTLKNIIKEDKQAGKTVTKKQDIESAGVITGSKYKPNVKGRPF